MNVRDLFPFLTCSVLEMSLKISGGTFRRFGIPYMQREAELQNNCVCCVCGNNDM